MTVLPLSPGNRRFPGADQIACGSPEVRASEVQTMATEEMRDWLPGCGGSDEESEGRLIPDAIVEREVARDSPRILSIECQPLDVCEKLPSLAGVVVAPAARSAVKTAGADSGKDRVLRERVKRLLISWKSATEYRFVNEVDAELERVVSRSVS